MNKCPQCGYVEVPEPNKQSHLMHQYVTDNGKRKAFMNRNEEKFDAIKGEGKDAVTIPWTRLDIWEKEQANKKVVEAPKTGGVK